MATNEDLKELKVEIGNLTGNLEQTQQSLVGISFSINSLESTVSEINSIVHSLATVASTGSYGDLSNTPTIPTVPSNLSSFNNDENFVNQEAMDKLSQLVSGLQETVNKLKESSKPVEEE